MALGFESLVGQIIWDALDNALGLNGMTEAQINSALASLAEKEFSAAPLVQALKNLSASGRLTFLVRGELPLMGGAATAFMRIELDVSSTVSMGGGPTLSIKEMHSVTGELKLSQPGVFDATASLMNDAGVWRGRGTIQVIPAGFGLDLLLGGLNDRGAMIGIDANLPVAIPLGTTGLGLKGIGGDFAYNFVPNLGKPLEQANATDYVTWAKTDPKSLTRWTPGPLNTTSVGIGIRCALVTMADNGLIVLLDDTGVAVLTPGPVFLLGGKGRIITDAISASGFLAVDIASATMALGLGTRIALPSPDFSLIDGEGTIDAFFSFADPSLWYLNFGTEQHPNRTTILKGLLGDSRTFLMLNNNRVYFGCDVSYGGDLSIGPVDIIAKVWIGARALVGWNPVELAGRFDLGGELGLEVFGFGFHMKAEAVAQGHTPQPTVLDFEANFSLSLPWPLPDVSGTAHFSYSDASPNPPQVDVPLLLRPLNPAPPKPPLQTRTDEPLGAIHALTGRQFKLVDKKIAPPPNADPEAAWPDIEIVVPFSKQVTDNTGSVLGPPITPEVQGGFEVSHALTQLELRNLDTNKPVPNLKAVWGAGPKGDTARLHVNAQDPFAWLTPHKQTITSATTTPPKLSSQFFGAGLNEHFTTPRRFNQMIVEPAAAAPADLVNAFEPPLTGRSLACGDFTLRFQTATGQPIPVDQVTLLVASAGSPALSSPGLGLFNIQAVETIQGNVGLWFATMGLAQADHLRVATLPILFRRFGGFVVYGVFYLESAKIERACAEKIVFTPGRYKLTVKGESSAKDTDGKLPAVAAIPWGFEQSFVITRPESLRPYIKEATLGDPRIFLGAPDTAPLSWNPTTFGVGFPAYRSYQPLVRYYVGYISKIFPNVRLHLDYEDGFSFQTAPNHPYVTSTLTYANELTQRWLHLQKCTPPPHQEHVLPIGAMQRGKAKLSIWSIEEGLPDIRLDEWTCYISQFGSFKDHVNWLGHTLQVLYSASGKQTRQACAVNLGGHSRYEISQYLYDVTSNHMDAIATVAHPTQTGVRDSVEAVRELGKYLNPVPSKPVPFPNELTAPPTDWRLPADNLGPLDPTAGLRFARFAEDTGARFNNFANPIDRLATLGNTVGTTSLEGVIDPQGRLYALWLRTPEPLDWRRVTGNIQILHVNQSGDCPSSYAHRKPLLLDVQFLPSPDASSVFVIGRLAGIPTKLPRGEYMLTLNYDPSQAGLPPLVPTGPVGSVPEVARLLFIQPSGQDWPLPTAHGRIPHYLELLLEQYIPIPPDIWRLALAGGIDPGPMEQMLVEALDRVAAGRALSAPAAPLMLEAAKIEEQVVQAVQHEVESIVAALSELDELPLLSEGQEE